MSKRINISVPDSEYPAFKTFKAQCRKNKKSVSKEIMKLIKREVQKDDLPDFLK